MKKDFIFPPYIKNNLILIKLIDLFAGYILSSAGYDVWLGNNRGNKYSRQHKFLDPDKDKVQFWDFSWHEMGVSDLPAMIDYVLNQTDSKALFYVGHSQVLLSKNIFHFNYDICF